MPDALARQARQIAEQRGETFSDVVRRALAEHIREYLEKTGPETYQDMDDLD